MFTIPIIVSIVGFSSSCCSHQQQYLCRKTGAASTQHIRGGPCFQAHQPRSLLQSFAMVTWNKNLDKNIVKAVKLCKLLRSPCNLQSTKRFSSGHIVQYSGYWGTPVVPTGDEESVALGWAGAGGGLAKYLYFVCVSVRSVADTNCSWRGNYKLPPNGHQSKFQLVVTRTRTAAWPRPGHLALGER